MFTGLIEETGKIKQIVRRGDGLSVEIEARKTLEDTKIGDSISVNGICLTVVKKTDRSMFFDVSQETVNRSNIKYSKVGDIVNLERAMKASDRFGGHIVQGHVDTVGKIVKTIPFGEHTVFLIEIPDKYEKLVVEKGSIAIDGISLTVNQIDKNQISINIIPHTLENTNLKNRKAGDYVNVEFDIIGKYVLNMLEKTGINREKSLEKLLENF